jgi:hypothetical protein
MQFWLDVISDGARPLPLAAADVSPLKLSDGEIRADSRRLLPIIALSATKDVQDAILADHRRSALVDVIDFRYWWRTAKGEFAPPGGKNLAPRQFERQWRGGRPTDTDLAGMAAEYRARFPGKPVICDFETAAWAWVCAGGSLPRLPKSTDARLLAAIPRMPPWKSDVPATQWALREPGRQMLVYSSGRTELDLSPETGHFLLNEINPRTGEVTSGVRLIAGPIMALPPTSVVVWLRRERGNEQGS